jgi:hypothetical protein
VALLRILAVTVAIDRVAPALALLAQHCERAVCILKSDGSL